MKKIVITPKIHVYKDVFNDVGATLNLIKETEVNDELGVIPKWDSWDAFWKGKASKVPNNKISLTQGESDFLKKQKEVISEIQQIFFNVFTDYINDYKRDTDWQEFIKIWDSYDSFPWQPDPSIDLLKYNKEQSDEMKNSALAMNYHTDNDKVDAEWQGTKKIVTVTFYLNDDYEGGEISLYDPKTEEVYIYKPKAGDVTVFPSGMSYYHGVLPFKGNDRYLIRMFMTYDYEGSKKWKEDLKKYGIDKLRKIEHDIRKDFWEKGGNLVNIVFPNQKPFNEKLRTINVNSDPIYIDGRKND